MKIAVTALSLLVGAGLVMPQWHWAAADDASSGASVNVVKATTACFTDLVRVAGYLVPRRVGIVNVEAEGYRLTEVSAAEGDQVIAGQVLARLTRQPQEGAAAPGTATTQRPMPASIVLHAPAAGLVMKSNARVSEMASPQGEPLFQILVNNEVELEAQVPSIHVSKLKSGDLARVAIAGLSERIGKVRLISPEIDTKTQLAEVRLALGSDPAMRVGTFAIANIDARRSCGVAIPHDAVDYRVDGTSVLVVRDTTVAIRRVTVGLLSDDKAEIREGLKDGEVVVANAGTSLHDGDKIKSKFPNEFDQSRAR